MRFLHVSRLGWSLCFLGLVSAVSHAQATFDEQKLSIDRLNRTYLSDEFSPINHQLVFPTSEPNLPQRTDETKATKLQIQALNSWQKEFDLRLQKIIDEQTNAHASNALVYQIFAENVRSIYEKLRRKEVNFATANQALLAAQKKLVIEPEAEPQVTKNISQQMPQAKAVPTTPVPVPIVVKKPIQSKSIRSSAKTLCDQNLVLLDSLLLEEENWSGVTSSLNQSLKKQSDREVAQQTQGAQSRERQEKIHELTMYRAKNCN